MVSRGAGLLLGYAADRLLGDPQRFHPVAGFGQAATVLERRTYGDSRCRGIAHVLLLVGGPAALGWLVERRSRDGMGAALLTAAVTWAVLGERSLEREADAVGQLLKAGELDAARRQVSRLVGRDTADLTPDEVARAVIESVAENTGDAVVASLAWGAIAGVPGLIAHRAANTLDAMIGHHNPRYERFGWAAARLDDVLGLPGSRLGGCLTVIIGPDRRGSLTAWQRDARGHPSPNAGILEASFAGALGIRLGGTNMYHGGRVEHRALMGDGRPPTHADVSRSNRLASRVGLGAVLTVASLCLLCAAMPRRPRHG